ncbi:unnamed protein product [Polarella glacialis]|uniref:UDP-N-acetylglucosamine diphosphorylase n=1 Tax=Polarella glacialis TaxID=89957 RepID=A0A813KVM1_POLGL|nr:unnamed protein product [Polarella glacialis]
MGQASASWCTEGVADNVDDLVWPTSSSALRPQRYSASGSHSSDVPDMHRLLAGCPRDLVELLKETGQVGALRCRPWLSSGGLRSLQRSLQCCQLNVTARRYKEAETPDEYTYSVPTVVPWAELDLDHVVSAGQVFLSEEAQHDKVMQLKRFGLQAIRQGKVGLVLLAGGANWRLGGDTVSCSRRLLGLQSGKSIMQLFCERLRRLTTLCQAEEKKPTQRISVPVFVMTSRLTHRTVVEHFEANSYFGLPPGDVIFFDQSVSPVMDMNGCLLPQSLGGEFAHSSGGTGLVLRALANSSCLEQCRDRGVECLHILGTENLLARVCDPVFLGFCRQLDIDCACKVTDRVDANEDLELFCVRQSPVSTQFADIEDAACGVEAFQASQELLQARNRTGALSYAGSINSVFMTVSYIEEVVGRPVQPQRVPRVVPYLNFHVDLPDSDVNLAEAFPDLSPALLPPKGKPGLGVAKGSWPSETNSPDLTAQRALLTAATEIRANCKPGPEDREEAWRCEVKLDSEGPVAVVRVREALRGPLLLAGSLDGPDGAEVAALAESDKFASLRCSLVVPSKPNTYVLETSILDYFAFTDRAVALKVNRGREFAPVRELKGRHTAEAARHPAPRWAMSGGGIVHDAGDPGALLEAWGERASDYISLVLGGCVF